jgi:outer membrane receptor for ferric coprogen and ferric-rhodotorulic acid
MRPPYSITEGSLDDLRPTPRARGSNDRDLNDRLYWQVTGFWREIDHIIQIDYDQPAYPDGIFMNMGEATIEGFELLGGVSLTDAWRAEASYTNAKSRLEGQSQQMNYNPRSYAKASITYDRERFGGSVAARCELSGGTVPKAARPSSSR